MPHPFALVFHFIKFGILNCCEKNLNFDGPSAVQEHDILLDLLQKFFQ